MAVSVIETQSIKWSANNTSAAITFASTPAAGDVVVLALALASGTTGGAASGMGATFSNRYLNSKQGDATFVNQATHIILTGVGANAAGTVTATWATGRYGRLVGYLVRGLPDTSITTTTVAQDGTSAAGPSDTAQADQFVFDMYWTNYAAATAPTFPGTTSPGSGWVSQGTSARDIIWGYWGNAYRIAGTSAAHQITPTTPTSAHQWTTQAILGGPPTPTATGTLPLTVGLPSAARVVSITNALDPAAGTTPDTAPALTVFAWSFSNTGGLDYSYAWQVVIERVSDNYVVNDTGQFDIGGMHTSGDYAIPSAYGGVPLRWRVRGYTSTGATSEWSSWVTFTPVGHVTGELPFSLGMDGQVAFEVLTTDGQLPFDVGLSGVGLIVKMLDPWTADLSQTALLDLRGEDSVLLVEPALAVPPATLNVRPILRNSIVMDPPVVDPVTHRARAASDFEVITDVVGYLHIAVSGKDVTYFRDTPTVVGTITRAQPFGDRAASVSFPQIGALEQTGVGDLAWLKPGATIEVYIVEDVGPVNHRRYRFTGQLMSQSTGNGDSDATQTWEAVGALYQGDTVGHRVPTDLPPTDIGRLIANDLNSIIGRRFKALSPGEGTGITSRKRGSLDDSVLDYVSDLLSTAWLEDGSTQWTVGRGSDWGRNYLIKAKDRTTPHWTLTTGAPGVSTDLSRDLTGTVNVIYGRGIGPDGYAWANWKFPGLSPDDAPAYPYASPATVMSVGSTDAGTLTGQGVTVWQRRAVELGHRLTVDGVFNSADSSVARQIQRGYGLLVDGIVGPQTWAATFDVGAAGGSLTARRLPLASQSAVEPRLYAANGADVGPNPAYDPTALRIERDIDYGAGVSKADALRSARAELAREATVGWTGTITLTTDPREGSRFYIAEGQNVRLLGFGGDDLLLHVVELSQDFTTGSVTLTVDEHARDAMTLAAIAARDRESLPDPARRPGNVNRRSRQDQDVATAFDGESPAGVIPRHALYGGLWTVIRIPVSQVGRIALVDVRTATPTAKFCLALFGAPITPSHLVRLVGDPLSGSDPFARTEAKATELDDKFGFIEAFGGPGSAAGYWPRDEDGGVLTGRLVDTGGVEYVSAKPPWVWVAEWSPTSTFISGRLRPAPVQ